MEEKASLTDEIPYFAENYPGKLCCLCNLSERSALGQGNLVKLETPYEIISCAKDGLSDNHEFGDQIIKNKFPEVGQNRFARALLRKPSQFGDCTYELGKIGHAEATSITTLQDGGCIYVHHMCAIWTIRRNQVEDAEVSQMLAAITLGLSQKCSFCGQYGATLTCKMNCSQIHHWPCAAASGCFLILESFTVFCTEHLSQLPLICNENNIECQSCFSLGDLSKSIMCCTCGDHFHSTCIGLANLPDTRSGWNCARCSKCQICRQQDSSDTRYVKCEQCQKIYHATCLRPIISSIPKYGWKCSRCRVCTDCGSRTPGAGTSSRWHCHYTICDSCYQQRNKGFSCPICQKAYRAAAYKEMVKCSWCHKFVHSTCDAEADLTIYHKKKESYPDYDYICPQCKLNSCTDSKPIEDLLLCPLQFSDGQRKDMDIELTDKKAIELNMIDDQVKSLNKKRLNFNAIRGKGGKIVLQRPGIFSQITKKRNSRGKGRQIGLQNSYVGDRCSNRSIDSDISNEKKMLLCSARDIFVLNKDICVMCGSVGVESDAELITCAHCGQCYHPYCVNVKPSKVMMERGWRCLDCTICEGCGKKNDEARLLLCDECDISYHIYCVDPPLDTVPLGNWKCNFCSVCQKCGLNCNRKSLGNDNNFFECASCASQRLCSCCSKAYSNGDIIIQCTECNQWLHFDCDMINKQRNCEYYEFINYECPQCRGNNNNVEQQIVSEQTNKEDNTLALTSVSEGNKSCVPAERNINNSISESACSENIHWLDGICVSEHGLNMIKALTTEIKRKRKLRQIAGIPNKDGSITVDSQNNSSNLASEEIQIEEKYKDGMVWNRVDPTPPDGFTLFTNDEGINILRKKRQRNLQKLGVGGFSVRNRTVKKDNDDNNVIDQSSIQNDKKKKIVRKKQKNKLCEVYPAYLQEAFFGKLLMDSGEIEGFDSESSDGTESCSMRMQYNDSDSTNILTDGSHQQKEENVCDSKNTFKTENAPNEETGSFTGGLAVENKKNTSANHSGSLNLQNCETYITSENSATSDTRNLIINESQSKPTTNLMHTRTELPNTSISTSGGYSIISSSQTNVNQIQTKTCFLEESILNKSVNNHVHQQVIEDMHMQNKSYTITQVEALQSEAYIECKSKEVPCEGITGGTQKTAEKMRRDEELGTMATISAVLYANTEHPNLKELYPNWNERCKQILKRWRSLPTEKKAPFLQIAKDNRSSLRMRRAQQEQQKNNLPLKTHKDDELEKAWKQHQTKLKETQANMSASYAYNFGHLKEPVDTMVPFSTANCLPKTSVMKTSVGTINVINNKPDGQTNDLEIESSYDNKDISDNKLRNILQKQRSAPGLVEENNDPFMHSNVFNLLPNNSVHHNPLLSSNEKLGIPDLGQSFQSLESDVKNRTDLKLHEPNESVSTTTVEFDKLETDENVGFGDILGGLGEGDDDDLLKSLTSEIGNDFNILEYADPELDVLATSQSVLNTLDFVENEKTAQL